MNKAASVGYPGASATRRRLVSICKNGAERKNNMKSTVVPNRVKMGVTIPTCKKAVPYGVFLREFVFVFFCWEETSERKQKLVRANFLLRLSSHFLFPVRVHENDWIFACHRTHVFDKCATKLFGTFAEGEFVVQ